MSTVIQERQVVRRKTMRHRKGRVYRITADQSQIKKLCFFSKDYSWDKVFFDCGLQWPNRIEVCFETAWSAYMFMLRLQMVGINCSRNWT